MKELAQCLRTPSPCRWISKRWTSRHTIIACEFRTPGKYANSFLIGIKLSQLTIFLWFGVRIGCARLNSLDDGYRGDGGIGLSTRSTTASSTSSSNSARISASFSRPAVCASCSSCFMRAREDLEARDNRKIAKDINNGMRTGKKIYMAYIRSNSVAMEREWVIGDHLRR